MITASKQHLAVMEGYFYEEMYEALHSYIIRNCNVAEIESITAEQLAELDTILAEFPLLDRSYSKFKEEWESYQ